MHKAVNVSSSAFAELVKTRFVAGRIILIVGLEHDIFTSCRISNTRLRGCLLHGKHMYNEAAPSPLRVTAE
jgi:hypothetical protein